ncbi:DEAD-box ATP-dependent RNA helicase 39-like [Quercus lobata]|uniref:DEAD-box ATP-dependent RNA helicase 39 n=1 Tax=Quercus lobata TaxID=97700 RepID=A0A7N2KVM4_QUELO|nr:DEAD-box ATP-dependent RNA helicase 39-like [Quercus lobata]
MRGKTKALLTLSYSLFSPVFKPQPHTTTWALLGFTSLSTKASNSEQPNNNNNNNRDSILLEKFRQRRLKGSSNDTPKTKPRPSPESSTSANEDGPTKEVSSFTELGLSEELTEAAGHMGVFVPSEIQCVGIPAVLEGKSVVFSAQPKSGRTLAYLLPLVQLLHQETKPKHPRAVVLCTTEELSDEVFQVAKFISDSAHAAQLKSEKVNGSNQKILSNAPIGMIVGTPGEVLQHIDEGNVVPDEIKYLVLDEMDTMFGCGLGPEIQKILRPLKNHASKSNDKGFQTVLVTSTVAKILGEQLSPFVERLEHSHAGQIAAMLLEMDKTEVFHLTESLDVLKKKVAEAMDSLNITASES